MQKTKALVLLSGGLDSMLAAKVLQAQGIEVIGVCFVSNFFGAKNARKAARQLGVELKEIDFSEEHLKMVKNPKYGYGKNMNPCIDCHALMLRKAAEYLKKDGGKVTGLRRRRSAPPRNDTEEGYDFIATGEILGQRPMSQNMKALKTVAEFSGVGEKLIRPMSAKLLDETIPEKEGKVVRGRLLNIKGRIRHRQMELAEKYKIKEYSSPAGGCLLTDPAFSERLVRIFEYWPDCTGNDIELLKYGRVFWLNMKDSKALVVVGRNKEENEKLEKLAQKGDTLLALKDEMGPTTLIRNKKQETITKQNSKFKIPNIIEIEVPEKLKMSELKMGEEKGEAELLQIAGLLTGWYATKARGKSVKVEVRSLPARQACEAGG